MDGIQSNHIPQIITSDSDLGGGIVLRAGTIFRVKT
jgi:hypothetical protein